MPGLAHGIERNIAEVHKPLFRARQDALQESLEHQGPAKGPLAKESARHACGNGYSSSGRAGVL